MSRPVRALARLAVLSLAAAALVPAAAQAYDQSQPFSDPVFARYEQIAAAQWGGRTPSCRHPDGSVEAVQAFMFDDPDPSVASRAEQPGCHMWLDRDFWKPPLRADARDCAIVVHEWGHLLGYGHSSDPHSVMYESAPAEGAPGCVFMEAAREQAERRRAAKRSSRRRAARRRARKHRVLLLARLRSAGGGAHGRYRFDRLR